MKLSEALMKLDEASYAGRIKEGKLNKILAFLDGLMDLGEITVNDYKRYNDKLKYRKFQSSQGDDETEKELEKEIIYLLNKYNTSSVRKVVSARNSLACWETFQKKLGNGRYFGSNTYQDVLNALEAVISPSASNKLLNDYKKAIQDSFDAYMKVSDLAATIRNYSGWKKLEPKVKGVSLTLDGKTEKHWSLSPNIAYDYKNHWVFGIGVSFDYCIRRLKAYGDEFWAEKKLTSAVENAIKNLTKWEAEFNKLNKDFDKKHDKLSKMHDEIVKYTNAKVDTLQKLVDTQMI